MIFFFSDESIVKKRKKEKEVETSQMLKKHYNYIERNLAS